MYLVCKAIIIAIYVTSSQSSTNQWIYDPRIQFPSGHWEQFGGYSPSKNKMYFFGGYNRISGSLTLENVHYELDMETNTVNTLPSLSSATRYSYVFFAVRQLTESIYFIPNPHINFPSDRSDMVYSISKYDMKTNTFEENINSIPSAYHWNDYISCMAIIEDTYLSFTGGYNYPDATNNLITYNINTNTWDTSLSNMKDTRYGHACVYATGFLYVIGGYVQSCSGCTQTITNTIMYYDFYNTKTWSYMLDTISSDIQSPTAIFLEPVNAIYVLSGGSVAKTSIIHTNTKTTSDGNDLPYTALQPTLIYNSNNSMIYMFGGADKNGNANNKVSYLMGPTNAPTFSPTQSTLIPTKQPTISPSDNPTLIPTRFPSNSPTEYTNNPSVIPSTIPSETPTVIPSKTPSEMVTQFPSHVPVVINVENSGNQFDDQYFASLMYITMGILLFVCIVIIGSGFLHWNVNKKRYNFGWKKLFKSLFDLFDLVTDIFLIMSLNHLYINNEISVVLIVLAISSVFIPTLLSCFIIYCVISKNVKVIGIFGVNTIEWLKEYSIYLYLLTLLIGSKDALYVFRSGLYNWNIFSLSMNTETVTQITFYHSINNILFENTTQLFIQSYLIFITGHHSDIVILALIFSILSVIATIFDQCTKRTIQKHSTVAHIGDANIHSRYHELKDDRSDQTL
eukprot:127146_1